MNNIDRCFLVHLDNMRCEVCEGPDLLEEYLTPLREQHDCVRHHLAESLIMKRIIAGSTGLSQPPVDVEECTRYWEDLLLGALAIDPEVLKFRRKEPHFATLQTHESIRRPFLQLYNTAHKRNVMIIEIAESSELLSLVHERLIRLAINDLLVSRKRALCVALIYEHHSKLNLSICVVTAIINFDSGQKEFLLSKIETYEPSIYSFEALLDVCATILHVEAMNESTFLLDETTRFIAALILREGFDRLPYGVCNATKCHGRLLELGRPNLLDEFEDALDDVS
ncbi:hypothetical protein P9112_001738 [Eukaryota sp. TZLM1-RC]